MGCSCPLSCGHQLPFMGGKKIGNTKLDIVGHFCVLLDVFDVQ